MNVAILSDTGFSYSEGGSQLYSESIARINTILSNNVFRVCLGRKVQPRGVTVIKGTLQSFSSELYYKDLAVTLSNIFSRFNVELVHANVHERRWILSIVKAVRECKIPLVITIHSWIYLCPSGLNVVLPELTACDKLSLTRCVKCKVSAAKLWNTKYGALDIVGIPLRLKATESLLKEAKAVISPSKRFAERLNETFGANVYYIPNPIDQSLLQGRSEPSGDRSIIFVGRLTYEKGVLTLLRLAKILRRTKIHVVGGGDLEWMFHEARQPNVIYHGFIDDRERLVDFMKRSSVVIVPSIMCEMFSYVTCEAFALGKPAVAFDLGGPKELIEASRGGLLVRPFDVNSFAEKVKYLLDNPSEAREMGMNGRKWAEENLHLERYTRILARIYSKCINN